MIDFLSLGLGGAIGVIVGILLYFLYNKFFKSTTGSKG